MRLPIIVISPNDIFVVTKIEGISYFEPIDVAEGEYRAWDRDGRRLVIRTEERGRKRLGFRSGSEAVTIVSDVPQSEPNDPLLENTIVRRISGKELGAQAGNRRGADLIQFIVTNVAPVAPEWGVFESAPAATSDER